MVDITEDIFWEQSSVGEYIPHNSGRWKCNIIPVFRIWFNYKYLLMKDLLISQHVFITLTVLQSFSTSLSKTLHILVKKIDFIQTLYYSNILQVKKVWIEK